MEEDNKVKETYIKSCISYYLHGIISKKQLGLKKFSKNYWSVKVLVTCTQFSHCSLTTFTINSHFSLTNFGEII